MTKPELAQFCQVGWCLHEAHPTLTEHSLFMARSIQVTLEKLIHVILPILGNPLGQSRSTSLSHSTRLMQGTFFLAVFYTTVNARLELTRQIDPDWGISPQRALDSSWSNVTKIFGWG